MISPFKAVMGGQYREVEARLAAAIHRRFGLRRGLSFSGFADKAAADRIIHLVDAAAVARVLGLAGLWPHELTTERQSLERVFLELTAGGDLNSTQGQVG